MDAVQDLDFELRLSVPFYFYFMTAVYWKKHEDVHEPGWQLVRPHRRPIAQFPSGLCDRSFPPSRPMHQLDYRIWTTFSRTTKMEAIKRGGV